MVVVDGQAVPIGADLDSAWPSEIKLLEPTIEKIAVPRKRLIAVVQLDDGFSLILGVVGTDFPTFTSAKNLVIFRRPPVMQLVNQA